MTKAKGKGAAAQVSEKGKTVKEKVKDRAEIIKGKGRVVKGNVVFSENEEIYKTLEMGDDEKMGQDLDWFIQFRENLDIKPYGHGCFNNHIASYMCFRVMLGNEDSFNPTKSMVTRTQKQCDNV